MGDVFWLMVYVGGFVRMCDQKGFWAALFWPFALGMFLIEWIDAIDPAILDKSDPDA